MFNKLRERIHVFWMNYKAEIIFYGGLLTILGAGGYALAKHEEKKAEEEHRAWSEENEKEWAEITANSKKAIMDAAEAVLKEEPKVEEEKINHAFACGGQIESSGNNWLDDPNYPGALINTIPISSMGEFGKEILDFANEVQFGEFSETEGFKQETATVDVMIDFGHEVWKMRNPEESQEKQAR